MNGEKTCPCPDLVRLCFRIADLERLLHQKTGKMDGKQQTIRDLRRVIRHKDAQLRSLQGDPPCGSSPSPSP